jgi:hypothetical protein
MFGIGSAIKAVVMLVAVVLLAVGGYYLINLKADLAISENNNKKLQEGIQEQQALMKQMTEDIAAIQQINRDLSDIVGKHKAEVDALSRKFSQDARGQPRDFGNFAKEKPELVERLINRGTKNAMRCLEIASGAPRTEQELAAKTATEINKECPAIANPNYKATQ